MSFNFRQLPLFATQENLRASIYEHLTQARNRTLSLFDGIDAQIFRLQANPDFSPVGWHLGHIGFTEGLWLLERGAGYSPLFPDYRRLFAADGLAKAERQNLPSFAEICDYLSQIRAAVWDYLAVAPVQSQARLWYWLVQHESQHCETITWVLQLHHLGAQQSATFSLTPTPISGSLPSPTAPVPDPALLPSIPNLSNTMIYIEGGAFLCGHEGLEALDNEQPVQWLHVNPFWIDRYPVTQGDYRHFIEAGGYRQPRYWSVAGWQWLQNHPVNHPFHWNTADGDRHPVCGVSWYEADAYARFLGKRLPTEAEWEKAACWHPDYSGSQDSLDSPRYYPWGQDQPTAAHCNYGGMHQGTTPVDDYPQGQSAYGCYDLLGNVWEWTDTWFHPYLGFQPYPYKGYSMIYFDQLHRVLKGGSWATQSPVLRCAFRNWYEPRIRIHFAGFRCAYG